jgi:hypothetical protein
LILNGAEANTYNDGGDNVDNSNFYYRVYELSVNPNTVAFIQVPLGFRSEVGNNKMWDQTTQNINLITGLIGGQTYYLEVYFDAHVNYNGGGGTTSYDSNAGLNYRATFTTGNSLPVELTSFTALVVSSSVKLNWKTATETNNYGFEILRQAQDDKDWEKIGFVNGNGNSNSPKSYSFKDEYVSVGKYSYRLKQIDNDGQFEYSKTLEVTFLKPTEFQLDQNYPNPFNPVTTIRFNLPESGNVKLTLFNLLGQELKTIVNDFGESGEHTVNVDGSDLNSGVYLYKIESGSYTKTRKMTLIK